MSILTESRRKTVLAFADSSGFARGSEQWSLVVWDALTAVEQDAFYEAWRGQVGWRSLLRAELEVEKS